MKRPSGTQAQAAPAAMATDFSEILPGVYRWQYFSAAHKVLLCSHAVVRSRRLYIFDPVALAAPAMRQLLQYGRPVAIILTNANHERDSANWRRVCQAPVRASSLARFDLPGIVRFGPSQLRWLDWQLHPIHGATAGELALELKGRSLMIFGDAVTHLPGYGLSLLSEKYCLHKPTLRHNLRQLLFRVSFEQAVFAHGEPLLGKASQAITDVS